MFWKKNKDKRPASSPQKNTQQKSASNKGVKNDSQRIREDALASVRSAREAIGEETLDRIADLMAKKQKSMIEQRKTQLRQSDPERVAREILGMIEKQGH